MIQLNKAFLFAAFFFTIIGCARQNKDTATIDSLINKFPQLATTSNTRSNDYNLVRSISLKNPSLTIKLYSQPDSVDDKQQIILVTNSNLHSYAIPLFSNTYRDYWKFTFDIVNLNAKQINTTFERELNICLDKLNLNDTTGTAGKAVNEILYSLLHCQDVNLSDSSYFQDIQINYKNSIPEENSDSCYIRLKRNWEIMTQDMVPNKTIIYKHLYWDKYNGRVYQFDFTNFKPKKKNYFKVIIFRQDSNWHLLTL